MITDVRADRTELRLRLYENGFTPLANKSKMCLLTEWTRFEVTPELIQSRTWARSRAYSDTGLRCGNIVALDWDIDDKDMLNTLLDEVVAKGIVEDSPFVRIGKPPRELWVYRTTEKIGKRTTGHFLPPGADPNESSGYAVEVLGGGCQFAAFGQRDEHTAYYWPGESPLDHRYGDLPVITLAQVEQIKDYSAAFFERVGLERKSPGGGTDGGYSHAYDLDPDMVFEVKDMGQLSVAEMEKALRANPGEVLRCLADTFRPTSGSWACMASLVNGFLCISDHGTYTSHFPPAAEGASAARSLSRLGTLLAERFPAPPAPEPLPEEEIDYSIDPIGKNLDDNLAAALERFVYLSSDGLICDTAAQFMTNSVRNFRDRFDNIFEMKISARGKEERATLAGLWMQHPDRKMVNDVQLRPDRPGERVFTDDEGATHLNRYRPASFPAGGNAELGLDMLARLLPAPDERRFFMQWLGYKLHHPDVPGPAVVMVARDAYGTGRGSLINLMSQMFGAEYVKRVNFSTLTGKGTQAQYNDWMVDSLVVAVDEAQETEANVSRWQARTNAYEHLKLIIDPASRQVQVNRKGIKNGQAMTFASVFIASNHSDALVIPPADRRIAVLENGAKMDDAYWMRFHGWLDDRANVGAMVRALKAVDLAGYNPYSAPPMTNAKLDMIEAGASDLDRAASSVLSSATGRLMAREQFMLLIETAMIEQGRDFPDDWQRSAERIFARKTKRLAGPERWLVDGKLRVVRQVPQEVDRELLLSETGMLEEIAKNGPMVRPISASGKVIDFAGARKKL